MKQQTGTKKLQTLFMTGFGFLMASFAQAAEAAPVLSRVDVAPYTIAAGASATLSVNMTEPCPAGGCAVNLYTNDTMRLQVPSQIIVPQGASSASIGLTAGRAATGMEVIIQASYAGVWKATYPWVLAAQIGAELQPISMNATNFAYSGQTLSLTFRVSEACPSGGCSLSLYSTSKLIPLPYSFVIPAGATQGTLSVKVGATTYPVPVSFDASYNNTYSRSPMDFAVFAPIGAKASDGSYTMMGFGSSNRSGTGSVTAARNDYMARSNLNHNIAVYVYRQCKALYANGEITAPAAPVKKGEYSTSNGKVIDYTQTIKCSNGNINGHLKNITENAATSMYVGTSFSVQICMQAPIAKNAVVSLKTRNGGITLPTSVTIPAGSQCASFTAKASSGSGDTRIQATLNNIMIEGKIITIYSR